MNTLKNANKSTPSMVYQAGYLEGYRYGGCQAILERIPPQIFGKKNIRVLYIPQGFDAIDQGVSEALQQLASECIIATPDKMLETAIRSRPDLVLVMNGLHVFPADHPDHISKIRQLGIKTAVWFADDPYFTDDTVELSAAYDVVFTHEQDCISFYKEVGCSQVYYLPLAISPAMFAPIRTTREQQFDICFIGSAFWNRVELFDQLAPFLLDKRVIIAGGHWDRLKHYDQLSRFIRSGWVPVPETVAYYNGSRIVINLHRPTTAGSDNRNGKGISGSSINPRTYEISACGTLQITDVRSDLLRHYRPGYDIETFHGASDLRSKIDYYLQHEEERRAIAWRSLWTTRQYHTFAHRVNELLEIVS
ncbi:CgeB family protein [Paenibacillus sp. GM2]|uniref:CgeB family protein n=1 Tax=Paenibacillus sp. GM2 TaxID=1622070 RepID=UPI0008383BBB|nr:glycosyltransferase [Paenibacillus sp. GM2]